MRWDNLFDDLESQLEHELGVDDLELRVEEERLRLGRLTLRSRLRAASETAGRRPDPLHLWLIDGSDVRLRPTTFGRDWVSGESAADATGGGVARTAGPRVIIPLDAIASIVLDPGQLERSLTAEPDPDAVRPGGPSPGLIDRLGLPFALRDLARRRAAVSVTTVSATIHGTIDRVARDHFDLAVHERGTPRRASNVRGVRIVPMASVVIVRL
ncbi:hypothetical protein HII28_14680 [Planctomonas sp. JC2975]|uniref:hypothetical protein n=1 Tax=Planctomonas sp. JC2975 TaxID=2729626 RepID=UPI0014734F6B|nr:hypothetical protein [Planctomonas sp. JC2975]NNC13118.1 hypothetical protein [Planctomonas sp. JC2975]